MILGFIQLIVRFEISSSRKWSHKLNFSLTLHSTKVDETIADPARIRHVEYRNAVIVVSLIVGHLPRFNVHFVKIGVFYAKGGTEYKTCRDEGKLDVDRIAIILIFSPNCFIVGAG